MNHKDWLNNNELSIDIWEKKYRNGNESFDEWLDRVSGGNDDIRQLIVEKKFLFGGRILANRGIKNQGVCVNNCFVLESPEDSIEGIYDTARKVARTFSYGGGVGINISSLRPKGYKVNNAAKTTTGAVSFIDLFDTTSSLIGQSGRRGALMITLDSSHPDIVDFVNLKSDLSKATKANISVLADDEFMKAATSEDDNEYKLSYKSKEEPVYEFGSDESGNKKTVNAKELLHLIAEKNWEMAEPGMLFYDNINKNHLLSEYKDVEIKGTNPCLHPDTKIQTTEGLVKIKDMTKPMMVYSMDENGKLCIKQATSAFKTKENAPIIQLSLNSGNKLKLTPDHLVFTKNRGWVEAKDLTTKDKLVGLHKSRRGYKYSGVRLTIQPREEEIMEHRLVYESHYGTIPDGYDVHHVDNNSYNNVYMNLELLSHSQHATLTRYSCDNDHMVQDPETGRFISPPTSKHGKKTIVSMPKHLVSKFGFCPKIVSIEQCESSDVYDISVEDTHNFIAEGIIVHNCGEFRLSIITS